MARDLPVPENLGNGKKRAITWETLHRLRESSGTTRTAVKACRGAARRAKQRRAWNEFTATFMVATIAIEPLVQEPQGGEAPEGPPVFQPARGGGGEGGVETSERHVGLWRHTSGNRAWKQRRLTEMWGDSDGDDAG